MKCNQIHSNLDTSLVTVKHACNMPLSFKGLTGMITKNGGNWFWCRIQTQFKKIWFTHITISLSQTTADFLCYTMNSLLEIIFQTAFEFCHTIFIFINKNSWKYILSMLTILNLLMIFEQGLLILADLREQRIICNIVFKLVETKLSYKYKYAYVRIFIVIFIMRAMEIYAISR